MRKNVVLLILLLVCTASNVYSDGNVKVADAPGGTPEANTLYRDNIVRAWVYFDGSPCTGGGGGNECEIKDSFNVTSVIRNSAGQYTVNWDTDFVDANYALFVEFDSFNHGYLSKSAGSALVFNANQNFSYGDANFCDVMAIGQQ